MQAKEIIENQIAYWKEQAKQCETDINSLNQRIDICNASIRRTTEEAFEAGFMISLLEQALKKYE